MGKRIDKKMLLQQILWILIFTVLTALSSQLVLWKTPVPFTLQTVIVFLTGAYLGSINGFYSMFLYILLGALGVPVFAGFSSGIGILFGYTGGYIIAFPFAAYIVGYILEHQQSILATVLAMFLGQTVIIVTGVVYLSTFYQGNIFEAISDGGYLFLLWGSIKIILSTVIFKNTPKKYRKLPTR